jgi:hypothetical protein
VPEHESAAQRLVRNHALSTQQKFVGEIAGRVMQQRGWNAEYRRPLQPPAKLFGEFAVGHRDRRRRVDRAGNIRVRKRMADQANQIVALDPGHPLPARSHRTAESKLERRQHPRQKSAFGADHKTSSQVNYPDAVFRRAARFLLPGRAEFMAEAGMGLGGFRQGLILPQAVPADRRPADQHRWPALQPRDQADDITRHVDPGIENLAALRVGP